MTSAGGFVDAIMSGQGEETSVVDILFDRKKQRLSMITEIPPDLIYLLSVLTLVQDRFKSKVLGNFLSNLYQLQISRDRKGRGELIEALLAARSYQDEGQ